MALVDPVIVIPGITAVYLKDEYPLPPEFIWKVLSFSQDYYRVTLHPNNLRYEALEPARIVPDQIYEIAYKELIEELRHNLKKKEDEPVPVYPFGYDWRMRLEDISDKLDNFIQEVIERTKLLKHYYGDGYQDSPRVNLVGHSMGGLIIAGYLKKKGAAAPINKVVTLATPFQGSFEAIVKVTTGNANFGTSQPSSREREAARLTPSLYHLLPSFDAGIEYPPNMPNSLFNPKVWQPTIVDTISEWIRLHGLPNGSQRDFALRVFTDLLQDADRHRQSIDNLKLEDVGLSRDKWLAIVGVDTKTRVHIKITMRGTTPEFYFDASVDLKNNWGISGLPPTEQRFTGDGTVPFEGAIPKFLELKNLVCVTPDDFEIWELQDKALAKLSGFHGILPNMDMLHRLIVRFFKGESDYYKNTWGNPAPGIDPRTGWEPPLDLTTRT